MFAALVLEKEGGLSTKSKKGARPNEFSYRFEASILFSTQPRRVTSSILSSESNRKSTARFIVPNGCSTVCCYAIRLGELLVIDMIQKINR